MSSTVDVIGCGGFNRTYNSAKNLKKNQGWRMRFSKISVKNMNDYVK